MAHEEGIPVHILLAVEADNPLAVEEDNPLEVEVDNLPGGPDGSNRHNLWGRGILAVSLMAGGRPYRAVTVGRRTRVGVDEGNQSRILEGGSHEGREREGEVVNDTLGTDFVDVEGNVVERDTDHNSRAADNHDSTDHQTPDAVVEEHTVGVRLGDA